tara:strand:- start:360 stop:602 length:243 start_codon:yes stop_codon:yes gene_type:complete
MFSVCSVTNAVITKVSIQLALAKLADDTNGRFLSKTAILEDLVFSTKKMIKKQLLSAEIAEVRFLKLSATIAVQRLLTSG